VGSPGAPHPCPQARRLDRQGVQKGDRERHPLRFEERHPVAGHAPSHLRRTFLTGPTGPPSTPTFASGRRKGCGRKRFKPWSAGTGSEKGDTLERTPSAWPPSALVMDSQSCGDHGKRGPRGNDGAKKVEGRKRRIWTDTGGRLIRVFVHPANERQPVRAILLTSGVDRRCSWGWTSPCGPGSGSFSWTGGTEASRRWLLP